MGAMAGRTSARETNAIPLHVELNRRSPPESSLGHSREVAVVRSIWIEKIKRRLPIDTHDANRREAGRVEDWRLSSVGLVYLLLPVSTGSAS
jgi:hypothetical protein